MNYRCNSIRELIEQPDAIEQVDDRKKEEEEEEVLVDRLTCSQGLQQLVRFYFKTNFLRIYFRT